MKITPQISLKFSVILGISLLVLLMIVLAAVGLLRLAETNRQVEQIVNSNIVKTDLLHGMKSALRERRVILQQLAQMQDPFRQNDLYLALANHGAAFAEARAAFEAMPLSPEEQEIHERLRAQARGAQPHVADAIALAMNGDTARAGRIVDADIAGAHQSIATELDRLLDLQKRAAGTAVSDTRKAFEFTRLHMLVLGSFAIGLALMVAPAVIRKANRQADVFQQEAMFDSLTGLPNRLLLADRLKQTVLSVRHEPRTFGVFVVDLDQLDTIRATLGDAVGDQVLQYLAACMQDCLGELDTLARLEGNEFAVLLMSVNDADGAIETARNIRRSVNEPFEIGGRRLEVRASIGMALFPHHGEEPEALLQAAGEALQVARQSKRGYRLYSADMASGADDRVALLHELRQAIANDELVLHYQPKIDFSVDRVSGVEALVRWDHPANGLMLPEQFIPLAEQIGMIKPLTDWVLDNAMQQYREWYQSGVRLPMSVKVTMASIQDPEFPDEMMQRLKDYEVPASKFEIEIKDVGAMSEPERAMICLRRLKAMGFQIAIGDFGAGSAPMSYLTELLVANIKLDKDLVKDMAVNRGGSMVVRTTVSLGHSLGLKVVAKGVENQDSWDALRGFGCDSAQGYYMSRPLPPLELMDWLQTSQWGASARSA